MRGHPAQLRALAAWYRDSAERAENPTIWEARLRTAEDLEREAQRVEQKSAHQMNWIGSESSTTALSIQQRPRRSITYLRDAG